ncbi:Hypothetical protein DEACI_3473 [Acididesulfobacillus acetoxydans]|uniref:Uncharacterized protein n=1 Tax=Acididesulfobacillus acetoxydans TaxID=1561005 RepID=A0A8S0WQQ6_9FIRM|nr:Hypothetical protein DEACI_3473 [Acididesulfobacillus acetoxydans]CEJ06349.1 Hypothetical protein DEACI_0797 [Acididesulfobacillus acetoxydans]
MPKISNAAYGGGVRVDCKLATLRNRFLEREAGPDQESMYKGVVLSFSTGSSQRRN